MNYPEKYYLMLLKLSKLLEFNFKYELNPSKENQKEYEENLIVIKDIQKEFSYSYDNVK